MIRSLSASVTDTSLLPSNVKLLLTMYVPPLFDAKQGSGLTRARKKKSKSRSPRTTSHGSGSRNLVIANEQALFSLGLAVPGTISRLNCPICSVAGRTTLARRRSGRQPRRPRTGRIARSGGACKGSGVRGITPPKPLDPCFPQGEHHPWQDGVGPIR